MADKNVVQFGHIKFWTVYIDKKIRDPSTGRVIEIKPHQPVDMVEYSPPGAANLAKSVEAVHRLSRLRPYVVGSNDDACALANATWAAMKPLYDAWKAGHEAPVDGVPLGAWSGVTLEQADVLRSRGIKTVEHVRDMSDSVLSGLPFPGSRALKDGAKRFLEASDAHRSAELLKVKEAELEAMRADAEELREMVIELQARTPAATPAAQAPAEKPKAGKVKTEAA